MTSLLAGIVGNTAFWLCTEVLPFLLLSIVCLIVLTILVVLVAFLAMIVIGLLPSKPNHAAEEEPPRMQEGEGSPD